MKIGIIGVGRIGASLGEVWEDRGHDVMYGVREGREAPGRTGTVREAATYGEVVVLAVPWSAVHDVLRELGPLDGKIVVDCTNGGRDSESSGAEKIAHLVPGAHVVKSFNIAGYETLANPELGGNRALMLVAGDDAAAKRTVLELGQDAGLDMVDTGSLATADLLEAVGLLWIQLAFRQGLGRDFAFGILRRR